MLSLGLSSRLALHERSVVEPVIKAEFITHLVLQSPSTSMSSSLILLNFYCALQKFHPDLFERLIFLIISESQITKLGNLIYAGNTFSDQN